MPNWTDQREVIERYTGTGPKLANLQKVPQKERRYSCPLCHKVFLDNNGICPDCGNTHASIMCPLDHADCNHDIVAGIETCPICGQYICPECGSHDVFAQSRVTGYLGEVGNWNAGKQQELVDRQRYSTVS